MINRAALASQALDILRRPKARSDDLSRLKSLRARGLRLQADMGGSTALGIAASRGKAEIVQWLLEQGADPDAPGFDDLATPLERAILFGRDACAIVLASATAPSPSRGGWLALAASQDLRPLGPAAMRALALALPDAQLAEAVVLLGATRGDARARGASSIAAAEAARREAAALEEATARAPSGNAAAGRL